MLPSLTIRTYYFIGGNTVSMHLSTVLSYNAWNVTKIIHNSVKIFLLALLQDKAKIFHTTKIFYVFVPQAYMRLTV